VRDDVVMYLIYLPIRGARPRTLGLGMKAALFDFPFFALPKEMDK
jgi:hypothetical protein